MPAAFQTLEFADDQNSRAGKGALAPCPPQYADAPGGGLAEFIIGRAFARPVGLAHPASQRPWDNIERCRDDFSIQLFKQPDADPHSRGAIAPELCKT